MLRMHRVAGALLLLVILIGFSLSSSTTDAADVVDEINITVPVACTMTGVGMNTHTASIMPGNYNSNIGQTTLNVLCNDSDGFAIYAIGYTNEVDGNNTLESTTLTDPVVITTGTGISGNSQWAMKLTTQTSPTPTYPITIENGFDAFHTVPTSYTKVASRASGTDIGTNAIGSNFSTTYQVYVSTTQLADTYVGKVKYTMVHPNTAPAPLLDTQFAIEYDGNGLLFDGGADKNRVVYGSSCSSMYMRTTPEILETSNLDDGEYQGPYYASGDYEAVHHVFTFQGASKIRVVVDYGLTSNTGEVTIVEGDWGGWDASDPFEDYSVIYDFGAWDEESGEGMDVSGTKTFDINGDTVAIEIDVWDEPVEDYDYGAYVRVYPIYTTEQSGTEEIEICGYAAETGAYDTPLNWHDKWFIVVDDEKIWFEDEDSVIRYVLDDAPQYIGSTLTLYAYNPYSIYYNGNGATAGTMSGFRTLLDSNSSLELADLMAPNFKKTDYGFAGWSADPNATINSNDKIYGPNETITGDELTFDNNHETTLYAIWVHKNGSMQDFSCSSLGDGEVTALYDSRDNNTYAVAKMADGNCWMMENLRLDAADSDDSSLAQGFGGYFTGLANSEDRNFTNSTASNSKYSSYIITGSNIGYRFPRYNNNNTNIGGTNASGVPLVPSPGPWWNARREGMGDILDENGNTNYSQWYSYGNYYTWPAAKAHTGSSETSSVSSSEATLTSICPSGWMLPYGRSTGNGAMSGGFSYLDVQMGGRGYETQEHDGGSEASGRWRAYPMNFVFSGSYIGLSPADRGTVGQYWSATTLTGLGAYSVSFRNNVIYPGDTSVVKFYGGAVRCLAQ